MVLKEKIIKQIFIDKILHIINDFLLITENHRRYEEIIYSPIIALHSL